MIKLKRIKDYEALKNSWNALLERSFTNVIFLTFEWQKIWWKHFNAGRTLHLLAFYHENDLVGIAPLNEYKKTLSINGGEDVSDFLDVIALKEYQKKIWGKLFEYLEKVEAEKFKICVIPETSPSPETLKSLCQKFDFHFEKITTELTPYIELPATWDEYLSSLGRKKRHEWRRKRKKIERAFEDFGTNYFDTSKDIEENLGAFFYLHKRSSPGKEKFMTNVMVNFFREVLLAIGKRYKVLLHFAQGNRKNLASTISFIYRNELLLYNSGFEPEYRKVAPGFILTGRTIKDAIEMGLEKYDFLRGGERYKYDLGAKDKKVYNILIKL